MSGTNFAEVLRQPFDCDVHNATFTNYCEVIILPDGEVRYAVPSHQEMLKAVYEGMGGDPINDCPKERYFDYLDWLLEQTGAVSVWYDFWLGKPNARQRHAIMRLKEKGCIK